MHVLISIVALIIMSLSPVVKANSMMSLERGIDDGLLPRQGDISDILDCAAANEVFWVSAMKEDPRNPEAHEAKRKAGWYSAVALWVFNVDSERVIDAVRSAFSQEPREDVVQLARQCRKAPNNWRE